MRAKIVILAAVLSVCLAVAGVAAPPFHPNCFENCHRFFGSVDMVLSSPATPAWRAITLTNPATGKSARFEFDNAPEIGGHEVLIGHWVIFEGQLVGKGFTCLDGVNTEAHPTFVYRWNASGTSGFWETFNPACSCWTAI